MHQLLDAILRSDDRDFNAKMTFHNQELGTFGSQVSIDKRSHGVYKELSSWVLAVYRSKQESKSRNLNNFE